MSAAPGSTSAVPSPHPDMSAAPQHSPLSLHADGLYRRHSLQPPGAAAQTHPPLLHPHETAAAYHPSMPYASASMPPYPMLPPIGSVKDGHHPRAIQQPMQQVIAASQQLGHPSAQTTSQHQPPPPPPQLQQSMHYGQLPLQQHPAFKLPEHASVPHYLKEIQAFPLKYDTKADQAARAGYYVYPAHDSYSVPHHPHHPQQHAPQQQQQPQQHFSYPANNGHTNGHANGHAAAYPYPSNNYASVYQPPSHVPQQQPPTPIRQTHPQPSLSLPVPAPSQQQSSNNTHSNLNNNTSSSVNSSVNNNNNGVGSNVAGFPTVMPVVTTQPVADTEVVSVVGNLRATRGSSTTSNRVTNVCPGLTLSECRKRQFHLMIRQQPTRARSCGFGEKDRRPIDPPPVIQLIVHDQMGRPIDIQRELPFYVMHVRLASEDGSQNMDMIRNNTSMLSRALMGSLAASVNTLQDLDGSIGNFFIFPSVSVRIEGVYRLRFSLINIITTIEPEHGPCSAVLAEVLSEPFTVYPAKKFPGMTDSTDLMVHFAKQGMKLVIRKDVKSKYTRQRARASTMSRPDDFEGHDGHSDGEESDTPSWNGEETNTISGGSVNGGTTGMQTSSSNGTTERHETSSKSSQDSTSQRRDKRRRVHAES